MVTQLFPQHNDTENLLTGRIQAHCLKNHIGASLLNISTIIGYYNRCEIEQMEAYDLINIEIRRVNHVD